MVYLKTIGTINFFMVDTKEFENIWKKRELGIDLPKSLWRPVTKDDLVYVSNHIYPFIQLVNSNPSYTGGMKVKFITASTGWVIHDYGDAISTSHPHTYKIKQKDAKTDDSGEGGEGTAGAGQQVRTTTEIAALIKEKGWAAVELIAGSKAMQRYLWMAAEEQNIKVIGYKPSDDDKRCADRVRKAKQARKEAKVAAAAAPDAPKLDD